MTATAERSAAANVNRDTARLSLAQFIRKGWNSVFTGPFRGGWHIDAIAEHLQAVSMGQIRRLLLIVPPQCSKSVIAGTFWPAWEWTTKPQIRWLFASNSEELALQESMRCRRLVTSEWYRNEFGIPWTMRPDQDTKSHFANTFEGERIAMGFSANVTGQKGNRLVIDDANDAQKVHSEAERKRVNRKFDNGFSDRHIDLNNDPTVVVGQRTHFNDLLGHLLAIGGWDVFHLREEFLPEKRTRWPVMVPLFDPKKGRVEFHRTDPRQFKGELLRPDDFGPSVVRERRRTNLMAYQAKHQGDPRTADGMRFKREWFKQSRWKLAEDGVHIVLQRGEERYTVHPFGVLHRRERYGIVDPSVSKEVTADYMVISTWIITERCDLIWYACSRQRAEIPDQPGILEAEYRAQQHEWCGIEATFGNRALFQFAMRTNLNVRSLDPKQRKKLERAAPAMILCESGRVWLPDQQTARQVGFPLLEVEDEIFSFTGDEEQDEYDDITDTLSYAAEHFLGVDTGGGPNQGPIFITGTPSPGVNMNPNRPNDGTGVPNQPPPGPFSGQPRSRPGTL